MQEIHHGLNFSSDEDGDEFGIFCIKFSTDGRELLAGTSDSSIYVYDLGADKLSLRIPAHLVIYIIFPSLVANFELFKKIYQMYRILIESWLTA